MTQQGKKQRRVGRRRWGALVKYLTETMKRSGSEKVRMAAAVHLKDVLVIKEQREMAELRAAARQSEPNEPSQPGEQEQEPQLSPAQAEAEAIAFLERSKRKGTDVQ